MHIPMILPGSRGPVFRLLVVLLAGSTAAAQGEAPQEASYQEASAPAGQPTPALFRFEPAPGATAVLLPRQERLVYSVRLDLTLFETSVGTVTQTCKVEEQQVPVMLSKAMAAGRESALIMLQAKGRYMTYELESTLETRLLPQEWPRIYYKQNSETNTGPARRREVMVGMLDGASTSRYRGDTSKNAPPGTRIFRPARDRSVPPTTVDMLTAVFMARTLVRDGAESLSFPLIDTDNLWLLELRRGGEQRMETKAGTFDAVEIVLSPRPYPGEPVDEKKEKKFSGVFGIQGSIHLWVERRTGVAVRIQGIVPIGGDDGLIKIGIDVLLESYSGTPAEFAPVPEPAKR